LCFFAVVAVLLVLGLLRELTVKMTDRSTGRRYSRGRGRGTRRNLFRGDALGGLNGETTKIYYTIYYSRDTVLYRFV